MTELLRASSFGERAGVVELLSKGGNPDGSVATDEAAVRPIHFAAARPDASALQVLLRQGAQLELADPCGMTAFHFACQQGSEECIVELVRAGCETLSRETKNSLTGRELAADRGFEEAAAVVDAIVRVNTDLEMAKASFVRGHHVDAVTACRAALAQEPTRAGSWIIRELGVEAVVAALVETSRSRDRERFRFYWDLIESHPRRHAAAEMGDASVCISFESSDKELVRDLVFDLVASGMEMPYCEQGSVTTLGCRLLLPVISTVDAQSTYGRPGSATCDQFDYAVQGRGRAGRGLAVVPLFVAGDAFPPEGGVSMVLSTTQFIDARSSSGWGNWAPRTREDWLEELVRRMKFFLDERIAPGVPEIFLSYRIQETATLVQWFRNRFAEEGIAAYVGETELQGGGDWTYELNKAIDGCMLFIPLISPTYATSDIAKGSLWTKREFDHASNKAKPILPLWCGGVYPPPSLGLQLSSVDAIDTRKLTQHEESFQRALSDFRAIQAGNWQSQEVLVKEHHSSSLSDAQPKHSVSGSANAPKSTAVTFESSQIEQLKRELREQKQAFEQLQAALDPVEPMPNPELSAQLGHGLIRTVSSTTATSLGSSGFDLGSSEAATRDESEWYERNDSSRLRRKVELVKSSSIVEQKAGWLSRLWQATSVAQEAPPREKIEREAGIWTVLRLFLSSTFTDTHSERDCLVKQVVPELNEWLARESYWVRVEVEDLRWGLGQDVALQATCIELINKCKTDGVGKPWMICLRTSRVGSTPQFDETVHEQVSESTTVQWMENLRDKGLRLPITSLEVVHGCLQYAPAGVLPDENPHCLCLFRDPSFESAVPEKWRWIVENEHISPIDARALSKHRGFYAVQDSEDECLKIVRDKREVDEALRNTPYAVCADYEADAFKARTKRLADGTKVGLGNVFKSQESKTTFENTALKRLKDMIAKEYSRLPEPNSRVAEKLPHKLAVDDRSRMLFGRSALLTEMAGFCSVANPRGTLAVFGEPGCGKSALMASFVKTLQANHSYNLLYHIVGSSPSSVNLRLMLLRLCGELMNLQSTGASPEQHTTGWLTEHWAELAGQVFVETGQVVVIVIDAANQLRQVGDAWSMRWIPKRLPRGVKIVVSMLVTEHGCLQNMRRRLSRLNLQELRVNPLGRDHRRELVKSYLGKYHKSLSEDASDSLLGDQMAILLDMEHASSPLFLVAACEQLRRYGVFEDLTHYMTHTLPGTARTLFRHVLSVLEADHGTQLVEFCLSCIALSKGGLSSTAMYALVESHPGSDTWTSSFSRLREALGVFLTAGGGFGLLQFFHEQLTIETRSRYQLRNPARSQFLLSEMADYFATVRTQGARWEEFFYRFLGSDLTKADAALAALVGSGEAVPGEGGLGQASYLIAESLDERPDSAEGLLEAVEQRCGKQQTAAFLLPLLLCHDGIDHQLHEQLLRNQTIADDTQAHLQVYLALDDAGILRFAHESLRNAAARRYGEFNLVSAYTKQIRLAADQVASKTAPENSVRSWFQLESAYQQLLSDPKRLSQSRSAEELVDMLTLEVVGRTGHTFFECAFQRLGFQQEAKTMSAQLVAFLEKLPRRDGRIHEDTFVHLAAFVDHFNTRSLLRLLECVDPESEGISPKQISRFSDNYQVACDALLALVEFQQGPSKLGHIPLVALMNSQQQDVNLAGFVLSEVEAAALVHCIEFSDSLNTITFAAAAAKGGGGAHSAAIHIGALIESERAVLRVHGAAMSAVTFTNAVCIHRYFGSALRAISLVGTAFSRDEDDFSDGVGLQFASMLQWTPLLESLDLTNTGISQRVSQAICMAAVDCPQLTDLDMRGNPLEFGALVHLLQCTRNDFTLNGLQLGPEGTAMELKAQLCEENEAVAHAVLISCGCIVARVWSTLTSLDLSMNPIRDQGAIAIAAGLASQDSPCAALATLILQDCDIGPVGSKALFTAILPHASTSGIVYLADEPELAMQTTFGTLGRNLDIGYEGGAVKILQLERQGYSKSLSLHAPGSVTFDVSRFSGCATAVLNLAAAVNSDVQDQLYGFVFDVIGDGKILWSSDVVDDTRTLEQCQELDIRGIKFLTLATRCTSVNWGGHTVFVNPNIVATHHDEALAGRAMSLMCLDLQHNCVHGVQAWNVQSKEYDFIEDKSAAELLRQVQIQCAIAVLTTEGGCFSTGAPGALLLSVSGALASGGSHDLFHRVLSSERGKNLDVQLDERLVQTYLRQCLGDQAFSSSRTIISNLEGDTENLDVDYQNGCIAEWGKVSGVTHGAKVNDGRLDGIQEILSVHPLLHEGLEGDTALHIAVRHQRFRLAEELLRRGANPTIKNIWRQTALDVADYVEYNEGSVPESLMALLDDDEEESDEESSSSASSHASQSM